MNDFKGTPGPWTVDNTNAFGVYGVWTDYVTHPGHDGAGYGSQICSMFTVSFQQTDKATRPQRDANANLIAAAPDLLTSLEEMVAALIATASYGLNDSEVAMLKRAEAALSKAKGLTT